MRRKEGLQFGPSFFGRFAVCNMTDHPFRYRGGEEAEDDLILHLPVETGWICRSGGDVLLHGSDGGLWAWNRSINIPK